MVDVIRLLGNRTLTFVGDSIGEQVNAVYVSLVVVVVVVVVVVIHIGIATSAASVNVYGTSYTHIPAKTVV